MTMIMQSWRLWWRKKQGVNKNFFMGKLRQREDKRYEDDDDDDNGNDHDHDYDHDDPLGLTVIANLLAAFLLH